MNTTKKIAPVTANTNRDSPKIDFAEVEAGAKISVGLKGETGSANAAAEEQTQTRTCELRTSQWFEPSDRNWSLYNRLSVIAVESHNLVSWSVLTLAI